MVESGAQVRAVVMGNLGCWGRVEGALRDSGSLGTQGLRVLVERWFDFFRQITTSDVVFARRWNVPVSLSEIMSTGATLDRIDSFSFRGYCASCLQEPSLVVCSGSLLPMEIIGRWLHFLLPTIYLNFKIDCLELGTSAVSPITEEIIKWGGTSKSLQVSGGFDLATRTG